MERCTRDGADWDWRTLCTACAANGVDAVETDPTPDVLHADPSVGLCVDTGWAWVAGHDPLDWIRSHPERVASLHLRNQHGPVPAEDLLEGDVDVAASVGALPGYSGWLTLELWHPATMTPRRSMLEDTRRSVAFLRDLAGRQGSAPAGR